jgi:DNA-binding transcriptional LysR family regulator
MSWTKRLRLKQLEHLIILAKAGNLSDTARLTHSTQPGLSRWLKELEEDVGAPLFERHARGLKPTTLGEMLIGHAKRITSEIERAQHNLDAFQKGVDQIITIGTSPATSANFVPHAIMEFLTRYPRTRVEIHESTMDSLLKKLKSGQLDVVVGRFDNYEPEQSLRNETLYSEKLCVIARKDHPLDGQKSLSWETLCRYDWIVWPHGAPIRTKLDVALTRAGRKPPLYRIESASQVSSLWLLGHSDMISISSEHVARYFISRGLISILDFEIERDSSPGAVGMCWRDEQHPEKSTLELLECLRRSAQDFDTQ